MDRAWELPIDVYQGFDRRPHPIFVSRPQRGVIHDESFSWRLRSSIMPLEYQTLGSPILATRDDLRRILGELDDETITEIMMLGASVADVEEAALWASGQGDVLGKSGHPLAGVAAEVFDLVALEDAEEEAPRKG
jgi:hypothetical protein